VNKKALIFLFLVFPLFGQQEYFTAPEWRIPLLFECPRKGYFTVIPQDQDKIDYTSYLHYLSSAMMVGVLDQWMDRSEAAALTFIIGFLKEVEDGYREGFGVKDLGFNMLGIFIYVLFSGLEENRAMRVELRKWNKAYGVKVAFGL